MSGSVHYPVDGGGVVVGGGYKCQSHVVGDRVRGGHREIWLKRNDFVLEHLPTAIVTLCVSKQRKTKSTKDETLNQRNDDQIFFLSLPLSVPGAAGSWPCQSSSLPRTLSRSPPPGRVAASSLGPSAHSYSTGGEEAATKNGW